MRFSGTLCFQLRRAFGSKTLPYVTLFCFGLMCACFCETCLLFWGHDAAELPSAAVAWVGNTTAMRTQPFLYFINYLMLPLAAAIFGDSFCSDVKGGLVTNAATRSSLAAFVLAGAISAFLAAFTVMLAALVASQLLAYLAFPATASPDAYCLLGFWTAGADGLDMLSEGLFGSLRTQSRLFCNVLYCVQAALWSGTGAAAAYAVSLRAAGNRLVAIGVPALLFIVANMVLPQALNPYGLMTSLLLDYGNVDYSLAAFVLEPLGVLTLSLVGVALLASRRRDVLL